MFEQRRHHGRIARHAQRAQHVDAVYRKATGLEESQVLAGTTEHRVGYIEKGNTRSASSAWPSQRLHARGAPQASASDNARSRTTSLVLSTSSSSLAT